MYKVGVEMEVKPVASNNRNSVLEFLNNEGIPITWESYTAPVASRWTMKPDISVHGGFEIVSKPLTGCPEIEHEISIMTKALKGLAKVDRDCGLHVHISLLEKYWARRRIDVTTKTGRREAVKSKQVKIFCAKLLRNYSYFQDVIDAIVAPSRRVSGSQAYNAPISSEFADQSNSSIEDYCNGVYRISLPRHSVINYDSLVKYGTVEFRQFQGTINKTKILNWMRLVERFCARTSDRKYKNHEPSNYPKTLDGMCDFLGFGKYGVRRWARERVLSNGFSHLVALPEQVPTTSQSTQESALSATLCNHDNCDNSVTEEDIRTQVSQYGLRAQIICASCEEDHQIAIGESDAESAPSASEISDLGANHQSPELIESLLVLENNYNSYHRIRNSVNQYRESQLSLIHLRSIIQDELRTHDLPTELNNVQGVTIRFQNLINES